MKTVLIIGISGFTGRNFLKFVNKNKLSDKYKFIGCSRSLYQGDYSDNFTYKTCDLTNFEEIKGLILQERPTFILNFAGSFSIDDFDAFTRQNLKASQNLLEASTLINDIEKILLIGSAAEYGIPLENPVSENHPVRPVNFYGLTKLFQTQLASYYFRTHGTPVVTARTFNLTGDGISKKLSIGNFMSQIDSASNGDTLQVGNLQTYRDFLPIEIAVKHYWTLLKKGLPGEVYNVCSGEATKLEFLLKKLIERSGKDLNFVTNSRFLKKNDVEVITGSPKKLNSLYL